MRRLFVSLVAALVAITAGTLFLAFAGLAVPETRELAVDLSAGPFVASVLTMLNGDAPDRVWSVVAATLWVLAFAILVLPLTVTALAGAFGRFRSFAFYGGATGLLAVGVGFLGHTTGARQGGAEGKLMLLIFLTGALTGLVYWALAGRTSGLHEPQG